MKLLFLTGSRGEWGYIRPVIAEAKRNGCDCEIVATNMHLSHEHGSTARYIEGDGYAIDHIVGMAPHDTNCAHAGSLGGFLEDFAMVLKKSKPDWIVLAGDRGEQLMGAVAGAYSYIPTAHIQAGERSGNIDCAARMAIAKLVHLHFAANDDARNRLIDMGEELWRVHMTGAPQLDELTPGSHRPLADKYFLCVLHPTTNEAANAAEQIAEVRRATEAFAYECVWIAPNNDPGWRDISAGLSGLKRVYSNIPRSEYLQLLEHAEAIIGNSSSGLLEAPSYGTPCVNIGNRQLDRVRGGNVVDVPRFLASDIVDGIGSALLLPREANNPYGDGKSSQRIVRALLEMDRDDRLTHKRMPY